MTVESGAGEMTERNRPEDVFKAEVRLALCARYKGRGCWWDNNTGYGASHHDPFGGPGTGDLVGALCGRWIEIETKSLTGRLGEKQKLRQALCKHLGLIYIKCRTLDELFTELDKYDHPNWSLRSE